MTSYYLASKRSQEQALIGRKKAFERRLRNVEKRLDMVQTEILLLEAEEERFRRK